MATVNSDQDALFSVQDVAELVNKTDGRIRQICRALNLGTLYGNRIRLLKKRDVAQIQKYLDESGKNFTRED